MVGSEDKHEYQGDFFDYINAGSTSSAQVVCPIVCGWLTPTSVLDVGCGAGAWCKVWGQSGIHDVTGVDGDYVDSTSLLIEPQNFLSRDLSQSFDLERRFELVCSLEVAEHVPLSSSPIFVANLVRHTDVVLFSAAVPGQGGEFHVNEQPLEFWRKLFASHGFRCFDPLRPRIVTDRRVEPWYRYNTLLYVREERCGSLPHEVRLTEVSPGTDIAERAPLSWRLRNRILLSTPNVVKDRLVELKHAWVRSRSRPS